MTARPLALSFNDPLGRRLMAWVNERFPPANTFPYLALYLTTLVYGRQLTRAGPVPLFPRDILGFLAVWSLFLLIRVLDEHKDYAADCQNHPDRVLQKGLVTLNQLKVVGVVAFVLQLGISVWWDGGLGPVTWRWLALMAFVALMTKEFFIGRWLRDRRLLYVALHLLSMPLGLIWVAQLGAGTVALPIQKGSLVALFAFSFVSGLAFELAHKLDSRDPYAYARAMGPRRAVAVLLAVNALGSGLALVVLWSVSSNGLPVGAAALLVAALAGSSVAVARFGLAPSADRAKWVERSVGLSVVAPYFVLAAAMLLHRGVVWA